MAMEAHALIMGTIVTLAVLTEALLTIYALLGEDDELGSTEDRKT